MYRAAICGASGYTGGELLRILLSHPEIKVTAVTADRYVGHDITGLFSHLYPYTGMKFEPLDKNALIDKADCFFLALPHSASQEAVDFFYKSAKPVVDLSADFRLNDPAVYEKWYETRHNYVETLKMAVYGLPELYRDTIAASTLVANPGCYPTSVILGLYPALKTRLIHTEGIIADSKSGTSGAGRKAETTYLFSEINNAFRAYKVASHRHTPEIEQELSRIADAGLHINFTPHLLPVNRGILSTIYARLNKDIEFDELHAVYTDAYKGEPFVKVLPPGILPDIKNVNGTNNCEIALTIDTRTNTLIIVSVIDNLIKGASGQAVQNMNLMLSLPETTALSHFAVLP